MSFKKIYNYRKNFGREKPGYMGYYVISVITLCLFITLITQSYNLSLVDYTIVYKSMLNKYTNKTNTAISRITKFSIQPPSKKLNFEQVIPVS